MDDIINVIPINDIKPHTDNERCACCPDIEYNGVAKLIIHHAWDEREQYDIDYN